MGLDDKIENKAQEVRGHVKQGVGDATDNPRLQAEGEHDQDASKLKQAKENVNDAAHHVADAFKE